MLLCAQFIGKNVSRALIFMGKIIFIIYYNPTQYSPKINKKNQLHFQEKIIKKSRHLFKEEEGGCNAKR